MRVLLITFVYSVFLHYKSSNPFYSIIIIIPLRSFLRVRISQSPVPSLRVLARSRRRRRRDGAGSLVSTVLSRRSSSSPTPPPPSSCRHLRSPASVSTHPLPSPLPSFPL